MAECLVTRLRGDRDHNLEQALEACSASLLVFSAEASPELWGRAHGTIGWIYFSKGLGDRAHNIRESIAHHWQARMLTYADVC